MSRKNGQNPVQTRRGGPGAAPSPEQAATEHELLTLASAAESIGQAAEARVFYRQIVAQAPQHIGANLRLAVLNSTEEHHLDALAHWRAVVAADKDHLDALIGLANCLHNLGRCEESIVAYRRAIKVAQTFNQAQRPSKRGQNADIARCWLQLASVYQDLDQYADAEECLRTTIRVDPGNASAHTALGYIQGQQGRAAEAEQQYRDAIRIQPNLGIAHYYLALLRKHQELDAEVALMQAQQASGLMTGEDAVFLDFALGKVYEDLGLYQQAFSCWLEGNRRRRATQSSYTIDQDLKSVIQLKKIFSTDYLRQSRAMIAADITPVFIVSMPRAGSSLVEQILASHPEVYGGGELETLHEVGIAAVKRFPADLAGLRPDEWKAMGERYLEIVSRRMSGERYITNKLPANFQLIGMIRMMFPEARIVHCCREPMDTALSCFKNLFSEGTVRYTYDLRDLGTMYRYYEKLMAYWHRALPGWIYDIHYEKLTTETETEVRQLLDFVGLSFDERCLMPQNSRRVTKTASATQVREPIHAGSVAKWKLYERQLAPFRKARKGGWFGF